MLTYTLQVKQEKGLEKQDFCWKLTFSGYPSGKGHLHQQSLNVLTVHETVYAERFPWGLPLLNMHFNPVPRMTLAFILAMFYFCNVLSDQPFHLELKETCTNWPFSLLQDYTTNVSMPPVTEAGCWALRPSVNTGIVTLGSSSPLKPTVRTKRPPSTPMLATCPTNGHTWPSLMMVSTWSFLSMEPKSVSAGSSRAMFSAT